MLSLTKIKKINFSLLAIVLLSVSVFALATRSVEAQGSCPAGQFQPSGGGGCIQISRDNPGGSQECDTYIDTPRMPTADNQNCVAREYCDGSASDAEKTQAGCSASGTSGGQAGPVAAGDTATLDADCIDLNNCQIVGYIRDIINVLSAVAGVVIAAMIAYGGIQYTMSRDNPQMTAAAKGRIINALLALVIYLFTFSLLQWLVPGGVF
jgi:hypothetical protein